MHLDESASLQLTCYSAAILMFLLPLTAPNYEAAAFHRLCQNEGGPGSSEAELKFLSLLSLQTEEAPFSCPPEGDTKEV